MPVTLRAWLSLLVFFAVLAVVCFALPAGMANYLMAPLGCIVPAFYAAGLIYGPPKTKAFCVGAMIAFVGLWFSWPQLASLISAGEIAPATEVLIRVAISVVAGFLFQGAWWLVGKVRGRHESEDRRKEETDIPQR